MPMVQCSINLLNNILVPRENQCSFLEGLINTKGVIFTHWEKPGL